VESSLRSPPRDHDARVGGDRSVEVDHPNVLIDETMERSRPPPRSHIGITDNRPQGKDHGTASARGVVGFLEGLDGERGRSAP
jgi:hypothetical protein